MEDEDRDPALIEFSKADKRIKIIKCYGAKRIEDLNESEDDEEIGDINTIIDRIPSLDLPMKSKRSFRSCFCHRHVGVELHASPDAQLGLKPPVPKQQIILRPISEIKGS